MDSISATLSHQSAPSEAKSSSNTETTSSSKSTEESPIESQPTAQANIAAKAEEAAQANPAPQDSSAELTNGHNVNSASNVDGASQNISEATNAGDDTAAESGAPAPVPKAAPTSWAKLFSKPTSQSVTILNGSNGTASANGDAIESSTTSAVPGSNFSHSNRSFLAEAIRDFQVDSTDKATLIEPRGLINTGNMCYMNSVRLLRLNLSSPYSLTKIIGIASSHVLCPIL